MDRNHDESRALAFLNREPLLRVQPLEAFRRGAAEVAALTEGGALIYNRESDLYMLCADSARAVRDLLPALPPVEAMTCDCPEGDNLIMDRLGLDGRSICNNVVYLHGAAPASTQKLAIRPLDMGDAETVSLNYHIHGLAQIRETISRGDLMGGYLDGAWVGFFGWHEEGSMGMLHVFEPYRRRGFAQELEARQIALTLDRGSLPFGQVILGNTASLALQRKLGFTVEEKTVSWLYRTEANHEKAGA